MLVLGGPVGLLKQELGGRPPELVLRLADRGERHGRGGGELDVVVADHGQVPGYRDPRLAEPAQQRTRRYLRSLSSASSELHRITAAAAVLDTAKYRGKIALTGLGTPDEMKKYVSDGTVVSFERWNPADLGYLAAYAAVELASGKITGAAGQTFTAGKLGSFTVGADSTVLLGPPYVFDAANINNFNF